MGVAKILATQEYTHAYFMWNIITADDLTWVRFKANFQEAYLDRKDIKQTAGGAGYVSAKSVKHGKMEDDFMNFASDTAAKDAASTKLTSMNGKLSTKLRH